MKQRKAIEFITAELLKEVIRDYLTADSSDVVPEIESIKACLQNDDYGPASKAVTLCLQPLAMLQIEFKVENDE